MRAVVFGGVRDVRVAEVPDARCRSGTTPSSA